MKTKIKSTLPFGYVRKDSNIIIINVKEAAAIKVRSIGRGRNKAAKQLAG
jgi:hypothetical protein